MSARSNNGRARRKQGSTARFRWLVFAVSIAILGVVIPGGAAAVAPGAEGGSGTEAVVAFHAETGLVRFIGTAPGAPIARPAGLDASAPPTTVARAFLDLRGYAFGIRDQAQELRVTSVRGTSAGRSIVHFQQVHEGVPVLGGELVVSLDGSGNILSAGGEALPGLRLSVQPAVTPATARATALAAVARARARGSTELHAGKPRLSIYDSRILGGPGLDRPALVWRVDVTGDALDELVLVDAQLSTVALHFDQLETAKYRQVCDANNTDSKVPCTAPYERVEGGPASSIADVNDAYDLTGATYDFYWNYLGRDSIDGAGMTLKSTTRYCPTGYSCPWQNAWWDGTQMDFGQGYASADDVVGHELTHGVTGYTSHLYYWYQSGAINESLSDVFGEFVDLTDGVGTDDAASRWLIGEDLPGGSLRDMENPPAYSDPDRMTSPNYWDQESDNGGVHINSGVNNKAAFLITDGGTFNGKTVTGLGIQKAADIYYEVEYLLTSASDYADLYNVLPQACTNLIGTDGITSADCLEVKDAVDATEMNVVPPAAPNPEAPVCDTGSPVTMLFSDDLENPASGTWTLQTGSGTNEWYYPQVPNPYGWDATYATSGTTNFWGYDQGATADYSIAMTADVAIPAKAYLRFNHSYSFEHGLTASWDGGVLEYSTNAGATWNDAGPLLTDNGYTGTLSTAGGNPLGGRGAFAGVSNGYISSRASLAPLAGQSVRFRFRIGTDIVGDGWGWFVDDVRIYTCSTGANSPPTAEAGGPYAVSEGGTLSLNAAGSSDANGDPLTYAWDLDGDLDYNDVHGANPVVSWATLKALGLSDGPASKTIRVRVTDPSNASGTDSAALTLGNAAPTAGIGGPTTVAERQSAAWTFTATDPSPADQAGSFTYRIDWNGDGTVDQTVGGGASTSVSHTFATASAPTIKVTATDKDGAQSAAVGKGVAVRDVTPPETTITAGPTGRITDTTPTFTFSSEPGASFHCRLDGTAFAACASPYTTRKLGTGGHTFKVRAIDAAGNVDATPASRSFTIRSVTTKVTVVKRTIPVTAKRIAKVKLRCGAAACRGTLALSAKVHRRTIKIAGKRFALKARHKATVNVKLTRKGYKLLRQHNRLRVKLKIKHKQPAGGTTTVVRTVTLKALKHR